MCDKAGLKTYGRCYLATSYDDVRTGKQRVIVHVPHGMRPTTNEICGASGLIPGELKRRKVISTQDLGVSFEPRTIRLALAISRCSSVPLVVSRRSRLTYDTDEAAGAKMTVVRGYEIPTLQCNLTALEELSGYMRGESTHLFTVHPGHRVGLDPCKPPQKSVILIDLHCVGDCGEAELLLDAICGKRALGMLVEHLAKYDFRRLIPASQAPAGSLPRNKSMSWLRDKHGKDRAHIVRIGVSRRAYGCEERWQAICEALSNFILDFNRSRS